MNLVTPTVALSEGGRQSDRFDRHWLEHENSRSILALALLFALEASMFYTQLADQILPYFPRAYDQTVYTVKTYQLIDQFRTHGWSVFLHRIIQPDATGLSFTIQGALLSLVGGANRRALVSLNLIYFIALQVCLFLSVRSRTGNTAPAWLALAFLLSARTHFDFAGGLYDYRIDYSALCLYGIFCSLLIGSRSFINRNAVIGVAAAGVLLVLERFFTILYVGIVLIGLFLHSLIQLKTSKDRASAATGAKNLFICGSAVLVCVSPFLFLARDAIYNYYVVGHFLSAEKYIRAAEQGVRSLWDDLTYYPWSVAAHFGWRSLDLMAILLCVAIAICLLSGLSAIRRAGDRLRSYGFEFLGLALTIAVPLILLTLDYSKSPVVGGIVTVPCILVVVLVASAFIPEQPLPLSRFLPNQTKALGWLLRGVSPLACAVVGLAMFLGNGTAPQHYLNRSDLGRINDLNNAIAGYILDNAISHPSISIDRVLEYLNAATVQLAGWEHWGRFIELVPKFGHGDYGIFATPRNTAMKLLQESDIVVMSDPRLGREGSAYPMDTKIREYWSEMWQWTNANLLPLYETNINGIPYRALHKPTFKSEGGSGDWVTSLGLTLMVNRVDLQRWPFLILEGDINLAWLGGVPQPRAVLLANDSSGVELPASIAVANDRYRVTVDTRAAVRSFGHAKIQLTFDRYFVPKGINKNTHELVVRLPTSKELRAEENDR
jgi:hypothetical protein